MPYERPYEKLIAWKEAHQLCLWIYELTKKFPPDERYRLVTQMCKSAYSVPTNIAEGNARRTKKSKRHFFEISLSSLEELHYQCRLSHDLRYIIDAEFEKCICWIHRVSFLITRLRSSFM